jgi:hypothetical protein
MTNRNQSNPPSDRVERKARLQRVPIPQMRVSPQAQRNLNQARVDKLAARFDMEQLGTPVVSHRDAFFYVIDGQHRIEALKKIGYGTYEAQCWTYQGLTEAGEAAVFLTLNDTLTVGAYLTFKVAVQAGRPEEADIDRIVRAQGLRVGPDRSGGTVAAVHALRRVYRRDGPACLARTLRIVRGAYGETGMEGSVIDGVSLVCHRYDGQLDDAQVIAALACAAGGVNGLLGKAETMRLATGSQKAHCVAAAAVELINRRIRGKKLRSWWKQPQP